MKIDGNLNINNNNLKTTNTQFSNSKFKPNQPIMNSAEKILPLNRIHQSHDDSIEISINEESEFIKMGEVVKKVCPDDFVAHSVLGKGSFGEV